MKEDLKEIKQDSPPPIATMQQKSTEAESKYLALRTISGLYTVLSVIVGIAAGIALLYGLSLLDGRYNKTLGTTLIISSLISGIIVAIGFRALAEIIKLFIDLESNSRKQIHLLKKFLTMSGKHFNIELTENDFESKQPAKEDMPENNQEKIKSDAGPPTKTYAYVTDTEWICICGNRNPLDRSKTNQQCSKCYNSRDYVLKNFSKERMADNQ